MQLEGQGIKVIGLYVSVVDTRHPMTVQYDLPEISLASVVAQAYDSIEEGALEVLADAQSRQIISTMGAEAEKF